MTINELIHLANQNQTLLIILFGSPPILSILFRLLHGSGNGHYSPWSYLYSILIYLVCIPGIISSVLTAYALFFKNNNLLNVNVLIYYLPIISMILTLMIIRRSTDFSTIPGFNRLYGLMITIGVSFFAAFILQKMRIWVLFGSSITTLFVIAVVIFVLLKWGGFLLFGKKKESTNPPSRAKPKKVKKPKKLSQKEKEKVILQLAKNNFGKITPIDVAMKSQLSIEESENILKEMASKGHAEVRVSDSGNLYYEFPMR